MMKLEITRNASPSDARALSAGIVEFNRTTVPDLEENEAEIKFFVFAKDASAQLVGGIRASCFWNTLHIELLWLSPACRGTGVGLQMLDMAEKFAVNAGYELALVETTSWQARPFYEKCDYLHMATLPGRPTNHAMHYLHKRIVAQPVEIAGL